MLANLVSGESSFPGLHMSAFSLCAHIGERKRETDSHTERQRQREAEKALSGDSSYKD